MKKALALVLALVLALSMAVSAFAAPLVLPVVPVKGTELIKFVDTFGYTTGTVNKELIYMASAYGGGDFYMVLECGVVDHALTEEDLEDIKVVTKGDVTAELVDYNPETMVDYIGEDLPANKLVTYSVKKYVGSKTLEALGTPEEVAICNREIANIAAGVEVTDYAFAKSLVKTLNKELDTTIYRVVADNEVYVVKFSVKPNYSASYTKGEVEVTATCKNCKKAIGIDFTVINDVHIFGYEAVKEAALYNAEGEVRNVNEQGYSDFMTAAYGYKTPSIEFFYDGAEVISKTAFRAIEGKNITIDVDNNMEVTIKNVAKNQNGVNFLTYGDDEDTLAIEFGFLGNQKIASDFVIEIEMLNEDGSRMTYFDLREHFKEKIEEEDRINFYLIKDGKQYGDPIYVDFMTENYDDPFTLEIEGKAGNTLGQYKLDIAAPVAAEGEENPNTGAESVVGVVAALAVVSVVTAAAVSLKK